MGHNVYIRQGYATSNPTHLFRNLHSFKMIKAIWPSIATMPNHLSPHESITSSGDVCDGISELSIRSPFPRPPMLFHLLADPVAVYVHPPTQSEVFVLDQGRHSPDSVASDGHLGVCSGSTFQRAFRRACNYNWGTILLELVKCDEQCAGRLLHFVCQHP